MAGPLQTTMFNGVSDFYNGVITSSLRFNGTNSRLESPTFGGDEGDTWTWSAWVKFTNQAADKRGTLFGVAGNNASLYFDSSGQDFLSINDDGDVVRSTSRLLRDPSSWYHICLNGNGTLNKLWINGVLATFDTNANLGKINEAVVHYIGYSINSDYYFDGLIADVNFVDGTALDYSAFAEFRNGILIPIEPNVTYSDNGFRLQFKQTGTSANASGIGADTSGNNKHFTVTNFDAHDVLPDSPENNFPTFNALLTTNTGSLSEGNLKSNSVVGGGSKYGTNGSTFLLKSGKWYAEMLMIGGSSIGATFSGAVTYRNDSSTRIGFDIAIVYTTVIYSNGGVVQSGLSGISAGDVFGFAVDVDNKTCQVYKNGSTYGSQIDWSGNTYADNGFSGLGHGHGSSLSNSTIAVNYGQDSSFAGNKTSGSENAQDANGIGDFYDTVPSDFLALCSANLPEPTISANSDTQADDYFTPYIYTGNDTNPRAFTDVGFQADWIWVKKRSGSGTSHHITADSSRGDNKTMLINADNSEATNDLNGYISDTTTAGGFTVNAGSSSDEMVNDGSDTYVAWLWKANGGITSNNTDGSITSTVQANTDAGFSIVTYNINTASVVTVGHGLTKAPEVIINKGRDSASAWWTFTTVIDGTLDYLRLDGTNAKVDDSLLALPTSSVFSQVQNYTLQQNVVSYCFHSVEGYSRFGKYTGNSSSTGDGTFVYLGFKPSFVMLKDIGGGEWGMFDSARNTFNVVNKNIGAQSDGLEYDGDTNRDIDFLSNGFKLRNGSALVFNNSSRSYIYMAFGETFKYANAR